MSSECFCLGPLASKNQFLHPFLIDLIVIFSRVPGPIHGVHFRNELCQLPLMSVIFSATKVFYNISSLGGLAIYQCPTHFLGTCPKLFINSYNAQFHCIKGKWHDRRHLYYNFRPRRAHCCSVGRGHPPNIFCEFFIKLSVRRYINNKLA